jgi:hypothetical protein
MIEIKKLWESMPRDVQRKISCHDLKRIVDNYNGTEKPDIAESVAVDSDTPESDALWIYCVRNSGPMSGIRMLLKMQELERARDLARRGIDCAINGIGLMGEVPYDCREERDQHAKKIIERLEGYLIAPLNA